MPAVRGEPRGARVAQVVKTQLLTEAGAGHRERKMRAWKVRQERSTLGGGEREAVTAPRWHGARQVCASWRPRLPASRITTTSRVVVDSGAGPCSARRDKSRRGPQPVAALSERRRQQCSLGRNGEPALQEGLAGRDWDVDRRDLAERVGHRLFHTPAPPDDQLALPLVLGDRGRDHVER